MPASIVDTQEFCGFNEELKSGIRFSEAVLHQAMESLLGVLPEELRPAAAPILADLPLQYLVSQLPIYRHVDSIHKMHQRLLPDLAPANREQHQSCSQQQYAGWLGNAGDVWRDGRGEIPRGSADRIQPDKACAGIDPRAESPG